MRAHFTAAVSAAALLLCACVPRGPLLYPPYRWVADEDRAPIEMPAKSERAIELSTIDSVTLRETEELMAVTGGIQSTMQSAVGGRVEALNVNNFDEVADSSWFTNRLGRRDLPPAQIAALMPGFDMAGSGRIEVLAAKTQGSTPRMFVRDSSGRRFIIKFEPSSNGGMGLGAELISSLVLRAAGYNVPEDRIVEIDPSRFALADGATTRDAQGKLRPLTGVEFEALKERIAGGNRRNVRAVSSAFFEGEYIGPFTYSGTRFKDSNDRIPHQHRRELRGYRMFCALLNMQNPTSAQTADIFVKTEGERGYVKHYLHDFSSAFGGAGSWLDIEQEAKGPAAAEEGPRRRPFEPGLREPVVFDDRAEDGAGSLSVVGFDPAKWRPAFNNEAFAHATPRDDFWAARIIMRLDDSAIDAIVKRAGLPGSKDAAHVARALKSRRDAIGRHAFSRVIPLDRFVAAPADGGCEVSFSDLAVDHGFERGSEVRYRHRVQDRLNRSEPTPWTELHGPSLRLDAGLVNGLGEGRIYVVRIERKRADERWWGSALDLYVERRGGEVKILGLERR
ncbi:MAG: hypothetical protein JXA24_05910 [Proteobacteria bacterium]|nr:hypothetical protein [Pseudomonadota bacterium]